MKRLGRDAEVRDRGLPACESLNNARRCPIAERDSLRSEFTTLD
jgi:hypothetical protein